MKQQPKNSTKHRKKTKSKKQHSYTLEEILGNPLSRIHALTSIQADENASRIFSGFPPDEQERLLSFIQGAQGLKITYDSFFKYVMNPDIHPSRLEDFLSTVLQQKIKIHAVLPLEGTHMVDHGSFVIMDIAVELSDKTIVNVEIQKMGYLFMTAKPRYRLYPKQFIYHLTHSIP